VNFERGPHEAADRVSFGEISRVMGDVMLNNAMDRAGTVADRRQQTRSRALLDMFEEDRGRPPKTIEELRDWMGAQYTDQLQIRMTRWLHGIGL
jgi:hypothetical protein